MRKAFVNIVLALGVVIIFGLPKSGYPYLDAERTFGATNINGAVGNGALTAGISAQGELTVFRWPSPSYYDQLNYETSTADKARELPFLGAKENEGSFAGIYYRTASENGISWFRDTQQWTHYQSYLTEDSNVLLTISTNLVLGIEITTYDFILPEQDVLVRHYEIERREDSPVNLARFIYYENLAPCLSKLPEYPTRDWADDRQNDFALLYHSGKGLLVHFLPHNDDGSKFDNLLAGSQDLQAVDQFINGLDDTFGEGVYIIIGSDFNPGGFQCGYDNIDAPAGEQQEAIDAYLDSIDGVLDGSPVAVGKTTGALLKDLDLDSTGKDELTIYLCVADTFDGAKKLLKDMKNKSFTGHLNETERWWREWLCPAMLPDTEDEDIIRVSKRTLISIRTAYDKRSGAIVASIATQPPYGEDWPRDGAYINYALDVAGYREMVTKHNLFYARVQRKVDEPTRPIGTYAGNYYADGVESMPAVFLEIDETGLAAWTMWEHYNFIENEREKSDYLEAVYPAIKLAADALVECKDPINNLECEYFNEGLPGFVQDKYGAMNVLLGLNSASAAAREIGEEEEVYTRWEQRVEELKEAVEKEFDHLGDGWPRGLLPEEDPQNMELAESYYQAILPFINREAALYTYVANNTLDLAHWWREDAQKLAKVKEALDILVKEVPTRYTDHYGEVYPIAEIEGAKQFRNQTSIPHIWAASLAYLTAMTVYGGAKPKQCEKDLAAGGCSCSLMGRVEKSYPFWLSSIIYFIPLGIIIALRRIFPI